MGQNGENAVALFKERNKPRGPQSMLAGKAFGIGAQVIAKLEELVALEASQLRLQEAHPLQFRAQAAIHQSFGIGSKRTVKLLEANPERKGSRIDWLGGPFGIFLGLGQAASQDNGLFLGGGTGDVSYWDGQISGVVWTGEVYGFNNDLGFGTVIVTEVS